MVVDLTAEEDDPVEAADNNNDYEKEYKVTSIWRFSRFRKILSMFSSSLFF